MAQHYRYTDRAEALPQHVDARCGQAGLTVEQAAARYALDTDCPTQGFGVILADDAAGSCAWLQMSPGARHVVLRRLNSHGSVAASFEWASFEPDQLPDAGQRALFLQRLTWYAYPGEPRFFEQAEAVSTVTMEFTPDGHATQQRLTGYGMRTADAVETSEYSAVDVSSNWLRVPEFGDWDEFFQPIAA